MTMDIVIQGETNGEDVSLFICSIPPRCWERYINSYSEHFSRKHKELPGQMIRVSTHTAGGGGVYSPARIFSTLLSSVKFALLSPSPDTASTNMLTGASGSTG